MLGEFENYDNLLILKTCSKAFGLAALRVGFAVGNEKLGPRHQGCKVAV